MEIDALLQNAESQIQSWTKMPKIDFIHYTVYFFFEDYIKSKNKP
jgi:hypothetical protein